MYISEIATPTNSSKIEKKLPKITEIITHVCGLTESCATNTYYRDLIRLSLRLRAEALHHRADWKL